MERKKLLIVGIDPGTTIGFAVLDIESNLIHLDSSKQLDLNLLISETIKFGKAVLVGTDKAKVPSLVEAFAAKMGARIANPNDDLKVEDKKKLTNDFNFNDEHQSDALASALFAYKNTKALLDKIDFFAEENNKKDIRDKIKELVITKKISIKSAVSIIEKKDEESQILEKVISEKKLAESDFLRLYSKLKKYEAETRLIKNYNNSLRNRISILEKQITRQQESDAKANIKKRNDFREQEIRFLRNSVKDKEKETENLKLLIKKLDNVIANIRNLYILKKLDILSLGEFNFKNKILNIQRNDIILVDNPNVFSSSVIELLRNKVFVIVYKKPINRKIESNLPFVFLNAKSLKIEENKYFGFVEKGCFEMEKNKIDWVKKIVSDYKKEKEQLIG